jgi:hypothetical protein
MEAYRTTARASVTCAGCGATLPPEGCELHASDGLPRCARCRATLTANGAQGTLEAYRASRGRPIVIAAVAITLFWFVVAFFTRR